MREEVISSGGTMDPTPAASSVGPSSPGRMPNMGVTERSHNSKAASMSGGGSQVRRASLSNSAAGSALGPSRPSCRPWEREDLLRRLGTFVPNNWSGKPKGASSLACAQRGWVNVDVDKITCESCNVSLKFAKMPSDEAESEGEAFANHLDAAHKPNCPWKGNSCPESLVQFPPTPLPALFAGYKDRCDVLSQFDVLPVVSSSSVDEMRLSRAPLIDRLLSQEGDNSQDLESFPNAASCLYTRAQKIISLCGWEPRWLPNIHDCEEHSQSARDGCSFGPAKAYANLSSDAGPSTKAHSASTRRESGKKHLLAVDSKPDSRSPLLDCSLCGSSVRVLDFLTVSRPSSNVEIPETGKKMALVRGASAGSGISGWIAADENVEERDEEGTKSVNAEVDLNLTMAGGLSSAAEMGRGLAIGQPAGSEVGDRAASYESHGPRKRNLEVGGSSNFMQVADSVEGTVIDRDGDEVTDGRQPSKRARDSDFFDSSGAGPSHSVFNQESDQIRRISSAIDSTRASSVIAMDTICHSDNDDSMESVENVPGDIDEANFPSSSTYGNLDMNETSELNNSNQAQQSVCLQPAAEAAPGDMGISSTNDGEEVFNAETVTAQARDRFSLGISGGSVGMCASHEAQIHGAELSVHRADSVVGDVEPRIEDMENQGQTGESALDPGMDEIATDREDPHGYSQDMMSRSVERADSNSKFDGSAKAESVESGEKFISDNDPHPSFSCNAHMSSGYETTKEEVEKGGKFSSINDVPFADSEFANAAYAELPKGECNYDDEGEESVAFDPISNHNQYCPWVNGNVAAAGSSSESLAFAGWQLTLDAIDAMTSLGHVPVQIMQSESAASLYKDDQEGPAEAVLGKPSLSRSQGQR